MVEAQSPVAVFITVIVAGVVLLSGFMLLSPLVALGDFSSPDKSYARLHGDTSAYHPVAGTNTWGRSETVYDSRGYAIHTTGADDSYVAVNGDVQLAADDTWTVQQVVAVDNASTDKAIVFAIGDPDLLLIYDNSSGTAKWSAIWYGATDSYRVNVSAPSPESLAHVYVVRNGSTFKIRRGDTWGESTTIDGDGEPTGDLTTADGCPCTLEETRAWEQVLTAAQFNKTQDSPVKPVAANQTLRIMYDRGRGDTVLVFWASANTATASNASWVDGFNGHTMSDGGVLSAGDYNWRRDGPEIKANDGGGLDGAPVAWVDYSRRNPQHFAIEERVLQSLLLGGVVLVTMTATLALRVFRDM